MEEKQMKIENDRMRDVQYQQNLLEQIRLKQEADEYQKLK